MPGRAKISPKLQQDGTELVQDYQSLTVSLSTPPSLSRSVCLSVYLLLLPFFLFSPIIKKMNQLIQKSSQEFEEQFVGMISTKL